LNDPRQAQTVLPDKSSGPDKDDIPLRDLGSDISPIYSNQFLPVEADSKSARAGHPTGKAAGTESTAFDFESHKVLLEPGLDIPRRG
jgi:hypothetical protein